MTAKVYAAAMCRLRRSRRDAEVAPHGFRPGATQA